MIIDLDAIQARAERATLAGLRDDVLSLVAYVRELESAREPVWTDTVDKWTEAIKAAFPTRSGSHDEYGTAMRMIGNRRSKGELVALVNWLLVTRRASAARRGQP